jgi:hypothetical protein
MPTSGMRRVAAAMSDIAATVEYLSMDSRNPERAVNDPICVGRIHRNEIIDHDDDPFVKGSLHATCGSPACFPVRSS